MSSIQFIKREIYILLEIGVKETKMSYRIWRGMYLSFYLGIFTIHIYKWKKSDGYEKENSHKDKDSYQRERIKRWLLWYAWMENRDELKISYNI